MAATAVYPVKVPDRLGGPRIVLIQKAAAVFFGEDAGESPRRVFEGLHVCNVDNEHVAGFCTLDLKRASQIMDLGEVDVMDVVCAIIIANLAAGPVEAFDFDRLPAFNLANRGDWTWSQTPNTATAKTTYFLGASDCGDRAALRQGRRRTQTGQFEFDETFCLVRAFLKLKRGRRWCRLLLLAKETRCK